LKNKKITKKSKITRKMEKSQKITRKKIT